MRMHRAGLTRQARGITMFGILIGIVLIITAVLPAIRAIPSLMEYQAIHHAIKIAREKAATREDVAIAFDKQAAIDDIQAIKGRDLDVIESGGSVQMVRFSYKREVPLYGPLALLITYTGSQR
ncbi:DUF4845 domain-containing protein [Ralstonia solanacearum P673]|uniref:DUF4845 domain-containing protein n=1 Tax=Ralstonia solanacearum TaxID=305 RepID=UPI00057DF77F|nr:DUF4845 domain-containing protein [Ralstonia solanacearum]MCL9847569.1 DUF4845 domain-containing protein [Ralstonia solanacearum]MCL9852784.1 DUF4845 domain-containing protein [Ralstonia solanacearum]MCL9862339.1 DUF4845 domain-containing protein [Ralstonia solanacearum]MCL9867111.1 DUF4845 domain-containing protein [Ralstonia solanacearum]MCL9871981.1 DUF4845 domain-containing protein [Ralstonia solanacearum]